MKESYRGNEFTTVLQGKLQPTAGWGVWLLFPEDRQVLLKEMSLMDLQPPHVPARSPGADQE